MKQKYYLRGLGFGILITAIVFILVGPSELSDEEIIQRAVALGYTKTPEQETSIGIKNLLETGTPAPTKVPEVSATGTPTPEITSTPVPTKEVSPSPTATPEPTPTMLPTVTPEPTATPTPEPTSTPVPTPTVEPDTSIITATIIVERGNTAKMVCDKIEKAGIIKDGDKLVNYMISNNLTDYINIGSYILSSDMSLKEISKILTGK